MKLVMKNLTPRYDVIDSAISALYCPVTFAIFDSSGDGPPRIVSSGSFHQGLAGGGEFNCTRGFMLLLSDGAVRAVAAPSASVAPAVRKRRFEGWKTRAGGRNVQVKETKQSIPR